jgi:hypothetical protein
VTYIGCGCGSTDIGTVREAWDRIGRLVVVDQICRACGRLYFSTRPATPAEAAAGYAHRQCLYPLLKGDRPMRFFDVDRVGAYLDAVTLRLEKTKDTEHKVIDLTLRVQPFDSTLAAALHPDVRALLFTGDSDGTPKQLLKAVELRLSDVPHQHIECWLLAEDSGSVFTLRDAEISDPRVRTEKGVDGYALIFYATIGPVGRDELEYVVNWYTQVRFLTFTEAQVPLNFDDEGADESAAPPPPARRSRRPRAVGEPELDGAPLRHGVVAEH